MLVRNTCTRYIYIFGSKHYYFCCLYCMKNNLGWQVYDGEQQQAAATTVNSSRIATHRAATAAATPLYTYRYIIRTHPLLRVFRQWMSDICRYGTMPRPQKRPYGQGVSTGRKVDNHQQPQRSSMLHTCTRLVLDLCNGIIWYAHDYELCVSP